MLRRLTLLLFLVFSSAVVCFADAGTRTLEEMIQRSKYIVLARVARVKIVDNVKLAELDVSGVLKGDSGVERLYYWASPSWVCDVSDAQPGEEALFFILDTDIGVPRTKEKISFIKMAHSLKKGARI
jgi:hypothetical protein